MKNRIRVRRIQVLLMTSFAPNLRRTSGSANTLDRVRTEHSALGFATPLPHPVRLLAACSAFAVGAAVALELSWRLT